MQAGAALTLANKDEIDKNVYDNVCNKKNHNSIINEDNDVQVQQGHQYLLYRTELTIWYRTEAPNLHIVARNNRLGCSAAGTRLCVILPAWQEIMSGA